MLTKYAPKWNETQGDWISDFYESGRRYRWRLGIRDQEKEKIAKLAAEHRYRQLLKDLLAMTLDDGDVIFAQAVLDYDASEEQRERLANAMEHFAALPISRISKASLWQAGRKHFPNASVETIRREFVGPAHAAIEQKLGASPVKGDDQRRERFLSPAEANRLLEAAGLESVVGSWDPERRIRQIIAVMIGGSPGPKEVFGIDASHV